MINLYLPARSQALHIPETGDTGHLFVVLTDTCKEGKHLLVPVCTQRVKFDRTCLLGVGDHPFVKVPSYVMYARMALYSADILTDRVKSGHFGYEGLIDEKLFGFICAGVSASDFAAPKYQAYYAAQLP